jgi:hypothetical protein
MVKLDQSLFPPKPLDGLAVHGRTMWQVLHPLLEDEETETGVFPMYRIHRFNHRLDVGDEARLHAYAWQILEQEAETTPVWTPGLYFQVPIVFLNRSLELRLMCLFTNDRPDKMN